MSVVYDLLTVLVHEEKELFVPESFEIREQEKSNFYDLLPVVFVGEKQYDYIANHMLPIPKNILDVTYKKATVKKGHQRMVVKHAFLLTDKKRAIVVDTEGTNLPLKKGKLLPQTFMTLMKNSGHFLTKITFDVPEITEEEMMFYYGLTRKEREIKRVLINVANELIKDTEEKIRYMLTELSASFEYEKLKEKTKEDMIQMMNELFKNGKGNYEEKMILILLDGHEKYKKEYEKIQDLINK